MEVSYHWWRSTSDFTPTTIAASNANVSALSPKARVLKEMERLAMLADESLDDLRHKLISYRSGDLWVPTGGVSKQEVDLPPVATILLVGFVGAGKSSVVNLLYSVLGRAGLIPFAQTSTSGKSGMTMCLEEHNVLRSPRSGFCLFDSRGLNYDLLKEGLEEVAEWMCHGVRHLQVCIGGPAELNNGGLGLSSSRRFARRRVNCPVVVVSLLEVYRAYKDGNLQPLEATKELFHSPFLRVGNEDPILLLTHGDKLMAEERLDGRLRICEFLGISETTGAYDIACLNEHGLLVDHFDPTTAYALLEAVYRALLLSDRNHPPKRSAKDLLLSSLHWVLWCLSTFFAFLANCFAKLAKRERKVKVL